MFNDETQVQDDTLQEETSEEVEQSTDETAEVEQSVDWEAEAKKWKAIAERTKKKKTEARADLTTPDAPPTESVDERILKSQGMSDQLLKELKRVARFNEVDLITAQNDPMFLAIKNKYEQEERDKAAALGASKGSGAGKSRKDFSTSGLSSEDHKALWKQKMGL